MGDGLRIVFRALGMILAMRRANPWILAGRSFLVAGVALIGFSPFTKIVVGHLDQFTGQTWVTVDLASTLDALVTPVGLSLLGLGAVFCIVGVMKTGAPTIPVVLYYLKGLPNQDPVPPTGELEPEHAHGPVQTVNLKIESTAPRAMLSELRFVIQTVAQRTEGARAVVRYFAGLARVPALYLVGYAFRQAYGEIHLLEEKHGTSRWFPLDVIQHPKNRLVIEGEGNICDRPDLEIGVVVEFTTQILDREIPEPVRGQIVRIRLNDGFRHGQVTSRHELDDIAEQITQLLTRLSKRSSQLHLFLSAQSTVVFGLGRRYQEGVIGRVRIYNYDATLRSYTWAYELHDGEISVVDL